jgi:hypothetical protein
VVSPSAGRVDEAARYAGDEELVLDLELNNVVECLLSVRKHRVEPLGLGDSTRESVKDKTTKYLYKNTSGSVFRFAISVGSARRRCHGRVELKFRTERERRGRGEDEIDPPALAVRVVLEVVLNHSDHDLIAHEPARVHDLLRLDAERGLPGDLLAEHVARGEMADAELLLDVGSLRTLACARHGAGKELSARASSSSTRWCG